MQAEEDTDEAVRTIPRISLADIDRVPKEIPSVLEPVPDVLLRSGGAGANVSDDADTLRGGANVDRGVFGHGGGAAIMTHAIPTSGVLYLDLCVDITAMSTSDLALIPLFSR